MSADHAAVPIRDERKDLHNDSSASSQRESPAPGVSCFISRLISVLFKLSQVLLSGFRPLLTAELLPQSHLYFSSLPPHRFTEDC